MSDEKKKRRKKGLAGNQENLPPDVDITNGEGVLRQRSLFDKMRDSEILVLLQSLVMKLLDKVEKLEQALVEAFNRLLGGVPFDERDFFTTKEFAKMAGLKVPTVQEYLREGRIEAKRTNTGRGGLGEFRIARDEVLRYQNEGLRKPRERPYRHPR